MTIVDENGFLVAEMTPADAAAWVSESWRESVAAIIETGRRLIEAKKRVGHKNWLSAVELMPFGKSTAEYLMQVGRHPVLSNSQYTGNLPASWSTLAVLAQLPSTDVIALIDSGKINPELGQREARALVRPPRPEFDPPTVDLVSTGPFDVLYADPPWRYEHIKTENRAIENQYPTMSLDEICALQPPVLDDAVLFMWATSPKLAESMQVVEAWGFEYRTCMVWVKDKIGMGYYVRQQHELLLIAKRGDVPVPEPSDRPASVVQAPRTEHSAKPHIFYDLIETMYPCRRYGEIFARTSRPGWGSWGNQVPT